MTYVNYNFFFVQKIKANRGMKMFMLTINV